MNSYLQMIVVGSRRKQYLSNAICRQNLDFASYYMWLAVKMYTLVGSMFFSTRLTWIYGLWYCDE